MSSNRRRPIADYGWLLHRWKLDTSQIAGIDSALDGMRDTYARVEALAGEQLQAPAAAPRWTVERVAGADRLHAWMYRTTPYDASASTGLLAGKRLAVKDSICVADVPMTAGSTILGDYLPARSALAVERAIDAGAELAGTAVCEDLCYSGSSFTSVTGPVLNPYDPQRAAGGSSSGCGALLATGEVDIALGTDLGGSVRNPAAWCGVCALKPTFGLVPYTGALASEFSMDHIGLMARTAGDIALLLDAVAGPCEEDPRQAGVGRLADSSARLQADVSTLRIGVVRDGFAWPERSDPRLDEIVRESAAKLGELCASIEEVSIELHRHARDIHVPISCEGGLATIYEQNLQGANHHGYYDPELAFAFGTALETRADSLPLNGKLALLAGTVLRHETKSRVMALAQSLRAKLRAQFEEALGRFDVLVMPTVPMPAHRLPEGPLTTADHQKLAFEMHDNNCATNLTGHPALSVPCGLVDGLPVGMLLIGRHLDDHLLLRVGHHFQERVFAPPSPPDVNMHKNHS